MTPQIAAIIAVFIGGLFFTLLFCIPLWILSWLADSEAMPFSTILTLIVLLLGTVAIFLGGKK